MAFLSSSSSSLPSSSSSLPSTSSSDAADISLLISCNWAKTPSPPPSLKTLLLNPLSFLRSLFPSIQSFLLPSCRHLTLSPLPSSPSTPSRRSNRSRKLMTGTFFGPKKGRVSFAVQENPKTPPTLLLDLATPTTLLVKEMASGTVRILLECENNNNSKKALWDEPVWTMYCNGHRLGYAVSRPCAAGDLYVLGAVGAVSVGAGVMPAAPTVPTILSGDVGTEAVGRGGGSEIMYMRAKFERVVGSKDSEAFYMISPDCGGGGGGRKFNGGGPELSIFLLRI